MAGRCELCGKAGGYGNNVSHSKRRTTRRWMPNIQKTRVIIEGEPVPAFLCTRCMRTMAKNTA